MPLQLELETTAGITRIHADPHRCHTRPSSPILQRFPVQKKFPTRTRTGSHSDVIVVAVFFQFRSQESVGVKTPKRIRRFPHIIHTTDWTQLGWHLQRFDPAHRFQSVGQTPIFLEVGSPFNFFGKIHEDLHFQHIR